MLGSSSDNSGTSVLHAYLICSDDEGGDKLAYNMARAAVCTSEDNRPCGACNGCMKAEKGIHPDIYTLTRSLDSKGEEKGEITVAQVRDVIAQAYILPNEAEKRVFIIEQAEHLNLSAQNALLKILEEPPQYVLFLLVTSNPHVLLPTILSRLARVSVVPSQDEKADMQLPEQLLQSIEGGALEINKFCVSIEKLEREAMREFLRSSQMLICRKIKAQGYGEPLMVRASQLLRQMELYSRANVSSGHIAGAIAAGLCMDGEINHG